MKYVTTGIRKDITEESEYKDCLIDIGQTMYAEYCAETFAYSKLLCACRINSVKNDLTDCILTYQKGDINKRVRRIVYFFLQYLAYYHATNMEVEFYKEFEDDEKIGCYIPVFKEIESAIEGLNKTCSSANIHMDDFAIGIQDLTEFEKRVL